MRMLLVVAVGAPILLIAGTAVAQDKPDFSGTWILASPNGPASSAAQTIIVHESFTRESVRGIPIDPPLITLAVERESNGIVHSERYTIGTIGATGTVSGLGGNPREETREETRFTTTWDGDKLVIDIRYSGRPVDAGSYSERKEVWSLDAQGMLLLAITERGPGADPTTSNLIYRRRP